MCDLFMTQSLGIYVYSEAYTGAARPHIQIASRCARMF